MQTERFVFGTNPGEYPPGTFIQDTLFRDCKVNFVLVNNTPCADGYDHQPVTGRLYAGSLDEFTSGTILVVNVTK